MWTVILSGLFSLSVYGAGFYILFRLGWIVAILYLAYGSFLEYRLVRRHCPECYYWGRTCGFGKGRLSALFFKQGDVSRFCSGVMTWRDMIPDLLVSAVPFVAGVVLLFVHFEVTLLIALLLLVVLTTAGNGLIRGSLTCRYCMQRELGCPADRLFNKGR
ncbi:MAG: hypothetical protein JXA20_11895 [Spirochaetes bacterium]|nr:hypothetical protein [Spirochaetota bacterium]